MRVPNPSGWRKPLPNCPLLDLSQCAKTANWLVPVGAAQLEGMRLLVLPPDFGAFDLPPDCTGAMLIVMGDDERRTGPDAFDLPSLQIALTKAHSIALVSCAGSQAVYGMAACAALAGCTVIVIEASLASEAEWFRLIEPHGHHASILAAICRAQGSA